MGWTIARILAVCVLAGSLFAAGAGAVGGSPGVDGPAGPETGIPGGPDGANATGTSPARGSGGVSEDGSPDEIDVEMHYEDVEGPQTIQVEVRAEVPAGASVELDFEYDRRNATGDTTPPADSAVVVETDGFRVTDSPRYDEFGLVADAGSSRSVATATMQLTLDGLVLDEFGIAQEDYALVSGTLGGYHYEGAEGVDFGTSVEDGVAADGMVAVGETTTVTARSDSRTFHLVALGRETPLPNSDRLLEYLVVADRLLPDAHGDDVYAFYVPEADCDGWTEWISAYRADAFWFGGRGCGGLDDTGSLMAHEFVHNQQHWETEYHHSAQWYVEGLAEYLEAYVSLQAGGRTFEDFRADVETEGYSDSVLTQPDSWADGDVPYVRGAGVMALADARLRAATNGSQGIFELHGSVLDEPTVSNAAILGAVSELSGGHAIASRLRDWTTDTGSLPSIPPQPELFTVPSVPDPDDDGLDNERELAAGTKLFDGDTDDDGLDDGIEVGNATNATRSDTDGDGLADGQEVDWSSSPTRPDTDDDGLDDHREWSLGTAPDRNDTDGDGLDDGTEGGRGTDPTSADTDEDGLDDQRERELGTAPDRNDTDGDDLDDGTEVEVGTDPASADTDDDDLDDGTEVEIGTNPSSEDTEGDGLTDGQERDRGTDPTQPTTSTATPTPTESPGQRSPSDGATSESPSGDDAAGGSQSMDGFSLPTAVVALAVLSGIFGWYRRRRSP